MKLPSPSEYQFAMHAPDIALVDPALRRCVPDRNWHGLPSLSSGGFALTFSVRLNGERYAIRCFHREGKHLRERYTHVAKFVRNTRPAPLVDVEYQQNGIRVGDNAYPIVRMSWVDGLRLDDWINDHLHERDALEVVRRNIAEAVSALRRHNAAHGDLQHGNVLVLPNLSVRLVDYDGMYLPALRSYGAAERGHRNYQHPGRTDQYDESLDQFAAAVVDLSLAALVFEPALWKEFGKHSGESLLFSADDLLNPSASRLFDRLSRIPALAEQTRRLRRACVAGYDDVPAALAGAAVHTSPTQQHRASNAAQPLVFRADDRSALLAHEGDEVTVVGRVLRVKALTERGNTTFINFGDYRLGAFTVVAWERGGRDLRRAIGDPANLENAWVAVTGLLTVYRKYRSATPTPQIELHSARMLRTVSAGEAATLLAGARQADKAKAGRPAGPPTSQTPASQQLGRRDDLTDRLGRLYSSPTFTPGVKPAQPTPKPAGQPQSAPTRAPSTPIQPARPASPPVSPKPQPPPSRRAPQHVPTSPYPPNRPPAPSPPARPAPAAGLGLAALVVTLLCIATPGPLVGLVMALYALSRGRNQAKADVVCSILTLLVVGVWLAWNITRFSAWLG